MAKDLAQIYIRAKDETGGAFDSLKRNAQGVTDSLGRINGTLAGLGLGISAGGFALLLKNSIDATAALDDLADTTALTVETLSSLQQTARIGGHSFEQVTGTATKFAKSVAEAAGGNKELLRSFDALGISQERLRSGKFDDLYTEFAKKIALAENKTYAIAYATELAGKSAAQALPFFKDLAETGLEQSRVSAQQAEAAERLQKEIGRLKNEFSLFAEQLGIAVVPKLLEFTEQLRIAKDVAGGFFGGSLLQFATDTENLPAELAQVEGMLAKLRKQRDDLARPGFANSINNFLSSDLDDTESQIKAVGLRETYIRELLSRRGYNQFVGDTGLPTPGLGKLPPPPSTPGTPDTSGLALIAQLENQLGGLNGQSSVVEQTIRKLTDGTKQYTIEVQAAALALAGEIDELKEGKAAYEDYAKAIERADTVQQAADKVLADFNKTQSEALKNLEFETSLLGMNDVQREQAIALRKLENEYLQASIKLVGEESDAYARRMQTTRAIYEGQRSAVSAAVLDNVSAKKAKEAHQKLVDDIKRQNEQITESLTDALLRGFESGKGFAENFRATLKNMFNTLVLRPILQPIAQGAAGAVTGVLGGLGVPGYTGGTFGGGGIGSSLFSQGVSSLLDPVLSGVGASVFGSAGAYAGALGLSSSAAGSQAALLAAQTGEFGLAGLAGTASSAGAGVASTALSALPYVGLALAAYSVLKGGSKGGPASFTGLDVSGTVGASGLQSSQWFGNSANSKTGFRWASHDHGATTGINDLARGAFADMAALADSLGLDKSRLSGATASFSFRNTSAGPTGAGPTPGEVVASFAQSLGQVTDQLALQLMPNLREFAQANETATQTLVRLVQVQDQLRAAQEQTKSQLAGAVRALPGQLGITSLEGARDALATSEYVSPMQRLAAARAQMNATYQRGLGGDLTAVAGYGNVLQQALTIGRDVGASGPAFQSLFTEGNRQLNELLQKQQSMQTEILRGVPLAVFEAAQDTIGELKRQTAALVASNERIIDELRRIREAA